MWLSIFLTAHSILVLAFLVGFLLTRRELKGKSSCTDVYTFNAIDVVSVLSPVENSVRYHGHCVGNHKRQKVFLFIIDALRLDFLEYYSIYNQSSFNQKESHLPFNKFTHIHKLLRTNSSQCLLLSLYADPPTVTAQRLKALTTGTGSLFLNHMNIALSQNGHRSNCLHRHDTYFH